MARLAEAYRNHLGGGSRPAGEKDLKSEDDEAVSSPRGPREELEPVKERLEEMLSAMVEEGKIAVTLQPRGLVVSLREAAFFPIGKASFRVGADELLAQVGGAVASAGDGPIRLEGHTDDVPIHNHEFASNWGAVELARYRGDEVAHRPFRRPARARVGRGLWRFAPTHPQPHRRRPGPQPSRRHRDSQPLGRGPHAPAKSWIGPRRLGLPCGLRRLGSPSFALPTPGHRR